MLQNPQMIRDASREGFAVPTYAYAANNPLKFTDPSGNWPLPWQPGKLCVSASCKPKDGNSCQSLPEESPKQGDPSELTGLPAPGTCTDSDGAWMDNGVYKIPNHCKCTVECDENGVTGLSCVCWPAVLSFWKPLQHFPPGTAPAGWPPNTATP